MLPLPHSPVPSSPAASNHFSVFDECFILDKESASDAGSTDLQVPNSEGSASGPLGQDHTSTMNPFCPIESLYGVSERDGLEASIQGLAANVSPGGNAGETVFLMNDGARRPIYWQRINLRIKCCIYRPTDSAHSTDRYDGKMANLFAAIDGTAVIKAALQGQIPAAFGFSKQARCFGATGRAMPGGQSLRNWWRASRQMLKCYKETIDKHSDFINSFEDLRVSGEVSEQRIDELWEYV